jgi:hypothetical protein
MGDGCAIGKVELGWKGLARYVLCVACLLRTIFVLLIRRCAFDADAHASLPLQVLTCQESDVYH